MREGGALAEGNNGFEGRARGAPSSHLIFDLRRNFKFADTGLQQPYGRLNHFACQNRSLAHLEELCGIFAHAKGFDPASC